MQDAVVSQLCSPPAALCAFTAMYQERKIQATSVDQGTMGLHETDGAVTFLQLPHWLRCGFWFHLRTSVLDCGLYHPLVWHGKCVCVCAHLNASREVFLSPLFILPPCLVFVKVFVCLVVVLTSSILVITYVVLLPLVINTYSPPWIAWHICYGHWNLVMIVFHYYKATKTPPGYPPTVRHQLYFSAESQITFRPESNSLWLSLVSLRKKMTIRLYPSAKNAS